MHLQRTIMRIKVVFYLFILTSVFVPTANAQTQNTEYYQLKIYHVKDQNQKDLLDEYLESAFIPALHRAGIKNIGVFYPAAVEKDEGASGDSLIYVLIPFKSLSQFAALDENLAKDKKYLQAGKNYLQATFDNPPYTRFESVLMQAFEGMPEIKTYESSNSKTIYELRSYEAATEMLHRNKVKMFEDGEIEIFDKLGFNAIFYARVISGSKMPNLMYMTSFENMESRDAHWKSFGNDPGWKKLLSDPQYNNNFLKADVYLLHAKPYSDI